MIMVMSLLEQQTNKKVIKKIYRQLPMDILKKNMAKIYNRYEDMYGDHYIMEAFNHWDEEQEEDDDKPKTEEYWNLITETGFLIFFLIQHYLELDFHEYDQDIRREMDEFKKEITSQSKVKKQSALEKSIFG